MAKTIVCHCEDITLDELFSAIEQGYCDIESVKRFTGIGTGECQGKCCIVQTLRVLASQRGRAAVKAGLTAGPGTPLEPLADSAPGTGLRIPTVRQPVTPLKIADIRTAEVGSHDRSFAERAGQPPRDGVD